MSSPTGNDALTSAASSEDVECSGITSSAEATDFEDVVIALVNEQRQAGATCGGQRMPSVPELTINPVLVCTARAHSLDMLEQDYFEHDSQDGSSPGDRLSAAGYDFRAMGENIALGQPTPESVMSTWMDSPGHCSNIMSGDFADIGVGYASDGERTHLWTQNFGRR